MMLFYLLGTIALAAAVNVVAQRRVFYSALFLIICLCALSGLYMLLQAPFIAAVQVIVYAGAIMVLFLFVIMLLNLQKQSEEPTRPLQQFLGYAGTAAFGIGLVYYLSKYAVMELPAGPFIADARTVGIRLFEAYIFPFEMVSILLLAAIVGALVLSGRGVQVE